VRKEEVDDREFYCADCDPQFLASIVSQRKPKPKRPRRRSVAKPSKQNSSKNKSKGQAEAEVSGGDGHEAEAPAGDGLDLTEESDSSDEESDRSDDAPGSMRSSNDGGKAKSADPPGRLPALDDSQAPSSSRLTQNYDTSSRSTPPSDHGDNPSSSVNAMNPRESLHFMLTTLQCLDNDLDTYSNMTTFCEMPRMKSLLCNIYQQIHYYSGLVSRSAAFDGGDALMHSSFSDMDSAVQLPFASCCDPHAASAADLQDTAPAWSLKSCSKFCPQLPDLESQIERECKYMMEQTWESLRQRNWGLGSRNQSFFQQMPGEEVFVGSDMVRQCLRAFSVIRSDVFFIDPGYNDSILFSEGPSGWPADFVKKAQSCKFEYVATIVSLQKECGARNVSRGYHWIVFIGNVKKKKSWFYDPTSFTLPLDKYDTQKSILDKFMSCHSATSFEFTMQQCDFDTNCQDLSVDGRNCGLWCVMYTMNWCLGTLTGYKTLLLDNTGRARLTLASKFLKYIYSDIHRHRCLLDITFTDLWQSPKITKISASPLSFWNIVPVDICSFCNIRYGSRFEEINLRARSNATNKKSTGSSPVSCPPQLPFFIEDGIRTIKIWRFLWGKVSVAELAVALHEISGTEYVSRKRNWFCQTFGVVTTGACASYVYVCLCRNKLDEFDIGSHLNQNPSTPRNEVISKAVYTAGVELYDITGVAHGDWHLFNMMTNKLTKAVEFIDFDRSFIYQGTDKSTIHGIIDAYANACDTHTRANILKSRIDPEGLNSTRKRFFKFAAECLASTSTKNLFQCGIEDFLSIFEMRR
jgi:hypothetical protein